MKKLLALLLAWSMMFPAVLASADAKPIAPVFYVTFETLAGGKISDFAGSSAELEIKNVEATDGYRGAGATISKKGYFYSSAGKIAKLLSGARGVTLSCYVKNGETEDGNLFTVYKNGGKSGTNRRHIRHILRKQNKPEKNRQLPITKSSRDFTINTQLCIIIGFMRGKYRKTVVEIAVILPNCYFVT